jgi:hypothetical protein
MCNQEGQQDSQLKEFYKQYFFDYKLKTRILGKNHQLQGASEENIMDKSAMLKPPNCRNFFMWNKKICTKEDGKI